MESDVGKRSLRPWNRSARRCVRWVQTTHLCALRALTISVRSVLTTRIVHYVP